ncbi:MAG TPA: hypothetical protein VLF59_03720 [Candidatus Saccharimonadales bacterium]|nr:hypothetical protein [Candidatus Saccharimonadales bacterium]
MATPQRLPIVNSDDGTWGDIIRQYLQKEHYDDGTDNAINGGHQKITVRAGTATAGTAPLKFTTGTLLTTPEAGAVEFASDQLYFTITTGTVRKKVAIYDDTSGATGDTYYRDSSGNFTRLGVGSSGQVLKVASGLPSWGTANGTFSTTTKTTGYTVTSSDTVVFADATSGNVTITLPTASGVAGYRFYVKRIDGSANTVTISRSGSDTIDGMTSFTLDLQYTAFGVVSNGSNWYIL